MEVDEEERRRIYCSSRVRRVFFVHSFQVAGLRCFAVVLVYVYLLHVRLEVIIAHSLVGLPRAWLLGCGSRLYLRENIYHHLYLHMRIQCGKWLETVAVPMLL